MTSTPLFSTDIEKSTNSTKAHRIYHFKRLLIKFQKYNFTVACIILLFMLCVVICLPAYLYGTIKEGVFNIESFEYNDILNIKNPKKYKYYYIDQSELNMKTEGFIFRLMFYFQAIFGKFLPCILVVIFTSLLIRTLLIKNRNKRRLINLYKRSRRTKSKNKTKTADLSGLATSGLETKKNQNKNENQYLEKTQEDGIIQSQTKRLSVLVEIIPVVCNNSVEFENSEVVSSPTEGGCFFKNHKKKKRDENSNNKTTLMLTIVCILFLTTELPQSILILLSMTLDSSFYSNVYMPLGDLLDMIALINNSVSFIIYCYMSSAFRETFCKMFKKYIPMVIFKRLQFKRKRDAIIYL